MTSYDHVHEWKINLIFVKLINLIYSMPWNQLYMSAYICVYMGGEY